MPSTLRSTAVGHDGKLESAFLISKLLIDPEDDIGAETGVAWDDSDVVIDDDDDDDGNDDDDDDDNSLDDEMFDVTSRAPPWPPFLSAGSDKLNGSVKDLDLDIDINEEFTGILLDEEYWEE